MGTVPDDRLRALAAERRYNLQETLVHAIFERLAGLRGVAALRVTSVKPDVYPDARGVGVPLMLTVCEAPWTSWKRGRST